MVGMVLCEVLSVFPVTLVILIILKSSAFAHSIEFKQYRRESSKKKIITVSRNKKN